jgi:hypothetical protein
MLGVDGNSGGYHFCSVEVPKFFIISDVSEDSRSSFEAGVFRVPKLDAKLLVLA